MHQFFIEYSDSQGRRSDLGKCESLVRHAGNRNAAVLDFEVLGRGLEQVARDPQDLLLYLHRG